MKPPRPAVEPFGQRVVRIAWPAFLAACLLEMCVFAVVDPLDLHWAGHRLEWSRQGAYSASFFVFWAISAGSCALTALLGKREGTVL